MNSQETKIFNALRLAGFDVTPEYKFLPDRKFRFDFAVFDGDNKIAVEFEGGVWTNGGHVRGGGYTSNCEKYNLAVMNGWKVLRYTSEHLKKNGAFKIPDDVRRCMDSPLALSRKSFLKELDVVGHQRVAQLAERRSPKPKVVGSIPTALASRKLVLPKRTERPAKRWRIAK